MGTAIISKGVSGEKFATKRSSPVGRGLEAMFITNDSAVKCQRNYALSKADGRIIGAPVVGAQFMSVVSGGLGGAVGSGADTFVKDSVAMTVFVAVRCTNIPPISGIDPIPAASRPIIIGNYGAPRVGRGVAIYPTNGGHFGCLVGVGDDLASSATVAAAAPGNIREWVLLSMTVNQGSLTLRNHTAGTSGTLAFTEKRLVSSGSIRIGATEVTNSTGTADIIFSQIHSVDLTTSERDLVVADIRKYVAGKGITV